MTRPIKFRAWDETYKEMWYFPLIGSHANQSKLQNTTVHIMQFTGLHDKNGKEIYEHDILRFPTEVTKALQEVLYSKHLLRTRNAKGWWGDPKSWSDVEVIGNIYENPDLLK